MRTEKQEAQRDKRRWFNNKQSETIGMMVLLFLQLLAILLVNINHAAKTRPYNFDHKVVTTSLSFYSQIFWNITGTSFTMSDCVVYCLNQPVYTYQMVLDGDGNCGCITDCWFSPPVGPKQVQFYVMSPILIGKYTLEKII